MQLLLQFQLRKQKKMQIAKELEEQIKKEQGYR